MPLFQHYRVESQLETLNAPTVSLKSGGYIVLNQTEALVAVDVNSGKSTSERSIEDTALHTNLEAADEIARQLRLRDLAGLVVIDFIDMEESSHNSKVEQALKEAMRGDRARIQLGSISNFGLLELSRQRLRPSFAEVTMQPCRFCHGTGLMRSGPAEARGILRQIEAFMLRQENGIAEVEVRCATEVMTILLNDMRDEITRLETQHSCRLRVLTALSSTPAPTPLRLSMRMVTTTKTRASRTHLNLQAIAVSPAAPSAGGEVTTRAEIKARAAQRAIRPQTVSPQQNRPGNAHAVGASAPMLPAANQPPHHPQIRQAQKMRL